jgi:micrococcal nuclease
MRSSALLCLLLLGCAPALEGADDACAEPVAVAFLEAVDGDTLDVRFIEGERLDEEVRVRLIGVDTPEVDHSGDDHDCWGLEAWDATRALEGTNGWLTFDEQCVDTYQRTLAYVWRADGTHHNLSLIEDGHARACPFPPNDWFTERFAAAEEPALLGQRGRWTAPCSGGPGCFAGGR